VVLGPSVDETEAKLLLPDPQTNGGLLIALAPTALKEVQTILQDMGIEYTATIGECTAAKEKRIYID